MSGTRISVTTAWDEQDGPLVNLCLSCPAVGDADIDLTIDEVRKLRKSLRTVARLSKREAKP